MRAKEQQIIDIKDYIINCITKNKDVVKKRQYTLNYKDVNIFCNLNILQNCIDEARLICGSIEDVIWNFRYHKTSAFYTFSGSFLSKTIVPILNKREKYSFLNISGVKDCSSKNVKVGYVLNVKEGGVFDNVSIYDFVSQYPSYLTFERSEFLAKKEAFEQYFHVLPSYYSGYVLLLLKESANREKPALVKIEEYPYNERASVKSKLAEIVNESSAIFRHLNWKQRALKDYANFMYGMHEFVGRVIPKCKTISNLITEFARRYLRTLEDSCNLSNIDVIYGDTDYYGIEL
ncbi:hypothetical protein B4U79_18659 [Dinothrombium tinctorium]|uniref:DNA-directed DNA polymerase n=1 Tax=Dinothrombium tinctorium TaxID=1965070 RepID=A0A3S3NDI8_9ACAR|nr:hypothetical protein B4U79_18659 [Dinothrombium tinctorium]